MITAEFFDLKNCKDTQPNSGTKEVKQKVEDIVNEIAQASIDASIDISDGESRNQPLHENPIGRFSHNKGKNPKLKQGK